MKKRYTRKSRHPLGRVDTGPVGAMPYRLLIGGRGAEYAKRSIYYPESTLMPTHPLREATRVRSLAVANAVVTRMTKGRIQKIKLRTLVWDAEGARWFLVLDF